MNISISTTERIDTPPLRVYETSYIYVGFRRYDTTLKKLQTITRDTNGTFTFSETEYAPNVIARGYHTELVRVTEYSKSPRIWKEEVNDCVYLYRQIQVV
jgi:hypothetical protein